MLVVVSKNVVGFEKVLGVWLMNWMICIFKFIEEGEVFLCYVCIVFEILDVVIDMVFVQWVVLVGCVWILMSVVFGYNYVFLVLFVLFVCYLVLLVEVDFDDWVIDIVWDGYDIVVRGGNILDFVFVICFICCLNIVLVVFFDYLVNYGVFEMLDVLYVYWFIVW